MKSSMDAAHNGVILIKCKSPNETQFRLFAFQPFFHFLYLLAFIVIDYDNTRALGALVMFAFTARAARPSSDRGRDGAPRSPERDRRRMKSVKSDPKPKTKEINDQTAGDPIADEITNKSPATK